MELNYEHAGITSGGDEWWMRKRREGAEKYVVVNDLTDFQGEVIAILLDPENGPEEYSLLLSRIDKHIRLLTSSGWTPKRDTSDQVNRPSHYARFPLEPTRFAMEYGLNWLEANTLKYLSRYPYKNGIEDLRKAARCLEMYIKFLDNDPNWST